MNDRIFNISWIKWRIKTENTTVGELRYKPGGFCGPRTQPRYQLVVLHSGSCNLTLDRSRVIPLKSGLVYLCQPKHHEVWEFSPDKETHHSWCEIKPLGVPETMREMLADAPFVLPPSSVWKHLFATILELRADQNPAAHLEVDLLSLGLFAEYLNMAEQSRGKLQHDDRVTKAIEYMRNHLGESDCLRNAERAAGVSTNTLIRYFRNELQLSPGRYLWKLRTEAGLEMLATSTRTVAEIAYLCGFKSPPHFSFAVKKLQGKSPSYLREKDHGVVADVNQPE